MESAFAKEASATDEKTEREGEKENNARSRWISLSSLTLLWPVRQNQDDEKAPSSPTFKIYRATELVRRDGLKYSFPKLISSFQDLESAREDRAQEKPKIIRFF